MYADPSFIVAGLSALDWEGTNARCMSLQRTPHPICSSGPETGVEVKAKSHERDLPSRSLSASPNSLPYALLFLWLTRNTDLSVPGNGRSTMHRGGLDGRQRRDSN